MMINPVLEAKKQAHELILSAAGRAVASGMLPAEPLPGFSVEIPADIKNGDFASNAAMVSAKACRMRGAPLDRSAGG